MSRSVTSLGGRVRALRVSRGLTQRALAAPRYSGAFVSSIESDRRRPSRGALVHFAERLGVSVDELETGIPPDLPQRLELKLQEARRMFSGGELRRAKAAFGRVAREARDHRLHRLYARAVQGIALCLDRAGDLRAAVRSYERAEAALADDSVAARVDSVAGRAACLVRLGEARESIYLLETLLDELRRDELSDPSGLLKIHTFLVPAYLDAGAWQKAWSSAQTAIALAPHVEDAERVAQMYLNVAEAQIRGGRMADAHDSLRRAGDLFGQLELRLEIAYAHHATGYLLTREGRHEEARESLMLALETYRELGDPAYEADCLAELARTERLSGDPDRARELLDEAFAVAGDDPGPSLLGALHRELGLSQPESTDHSAASEHLRAAMSFYSQAGQPAEIAATCRELADLLERGGKIKEAAGILRTGIAAVERSLTTENAPSLAAS